MKKIKLLCLIFLILITCTGCKMKYSINITKNTIEEKININDYITSTRTQKDILEQYNNWYPTYVNYITEGETIEIEDYSYKQEGIEYHNKNINMLSNGYNYKYSYIYPINKYYNAYSLALTFVDSTFQNNYDSLILRTSKENLLCNYDYFDSVEVNITIDPKVYKLNYTNTKNIKDNTYIWNLNRNNCKDSQIILTLNKITEYTDNNTSENKDNGNNKLNINKTNDYTMYIFCGILLVIVVIGYFILKKLKLKTNNFDIDG